MACSSRLRTIIVPFTTFLAIAATAIASEPNRAGTPSKLGTNPSTSAVIDVYHQRHPIGRWYVSETRNFRIYHNQRWELAERVARTAEKARTAAYQKWYGKAAPAWDLRCDIYLYDNGQDYNWETGRPAAVAGFAQTRREGGRLVLRRVDVRCDAPEMCTAVLPHEVTHIVVGTEYGADEVPHWVNEGIAVLSEPAHKIGRHLRDLPRYYEDGQLYKLRSLMQMTGYPQYAHLGVFYAQSVSVVRFLSTVKGPRELPRFLQDAARNGWTQALRRHYGWTFDELEEHWLQHTFGKRYVSAGG